MSAKNKLPAYEQSHFAYASVVTTLIMIPVVILLLFWVVWSPPDPPIPIYGVEVSFGTTDTGNGETRPKRSETETSATVAVQEQPTPVKKEPLPMPPVQETPKPIAQESDDIVPVQKEEKVTPPKEQITPPKEDKQPTKPTEEEKPKTEPTPVIEQDALLSDNKNESNSASSSGNNGNTGVQGKKDGVIDNSALLTGNGGSGGMSYDLKGWGLEQNPKIVDTSNDVGRVVIEFRIRRSDGEVVAATVDKARTTVSASVAEKYRSGVRKLVFRPDGSYASGEQEGTFIFNLTRRN